MILTKTFKQFGATIELRLYVPTINVDEINSVTLEVMREIELSLDFITVLHRSLSLCSNRAGLHYAFNVDCRSITSAGVVSNIDGVKQKLADRGGWKECKGA